MRRKKKNPGVLQELSPMSLYSRPPPSTDNETGAGNGGCDGNNNKEGCQDGTGNTNGSNGGSGTPPSRGDSGSTGNNNGTGNANNGGIKGSRNGDDHHAQQPMDFENFDYPDSPTQKWLADNADLSPLTVLDNINLKTEFPYAAAAAEIEKPPDNPVINSAGAAEATNNGAQSSAPASVTPPNPATTAAAIPMDATTAENLLQFAASVPVPDSSATFLDIGTDTFSQSLYDDLGDINLSDFQTVGNNNNHLPSANALAAIANASNVDHNASVTTTAAVNHVNTIQLQPVMTAGIGVGGSCTATTTTVVLQPKPVTLEKIGQPQVHTLQPLQPQPPHLEQHQPNINLGDLMKIKSEQAAAAAAAAASASMGTITMLPKESVVNPIKNLIEPLPASALKGLIKVEAAAAPPPLPPPVYTPSLVKVEQPEQLPQQPILKLEMTAPNVGTTPTTQPPGEVFSPLDSMGSSAASMASPGSPSGSSVHPHSPPAATNSGNGGGKMKGSPARKKSTSSSEEDDISNIPSLKMRIQLISQRVSKVY